MLLVSRWDDNDATDGALPAMVEALLTTVAPAAADRSADVRPLVAEAAQALAAAGQGSTAEQEPSILSVHAHNAEEIVLPEDEDETGGDDSERCAVGVESTVGSAAKPDHVHITNGVAECRLHEPGAEGPHRNQQPSTVCMVGSDTSEGDTELRTKHDSGPTSKTPKKARWLTAAERNKSRKKAKVVDVEQAVAMSC